MECLSLCYSLVVVNAAVLGGTAMFVHEFVRLSRTPNSKSTIVVLSLCFAYWLVLGSCIYNAFCCQLFPWSWLAECLSRVPCCRRRRRNIRSSTILPQFTVQRGMDVLPREPPVTGGAHAATADNIPVYEQREGPGRQGAEECAVCLGQVEKGETVKRMPACRHVFHRQCIDQWLREHATCPVCRGIVLTQLRPEVV